MSNKIDLNKMTFDQHGRVVLTDDDLKQIEREADFSVEGQGTNSEDCSGTTNDACRNTTQCGDSTNDVCVNGSYVYNCKDTNDPR